MRSRVIVPPAFAARALGRLVLEDWKTVASFAGLQLSKELFGIFRSQRALASGKGGRLRHIGVRITDVCNLRCHTCGQWGDNGYLLNKSVKELRRSELPVEAYKRLVDDVVAAGWSPLWYIWGGEPLLYPGIEELLRYIRDRGMPISIVTNGTNLARLKETIVETCQIVHVSLDGHTPEIHNTQRPGVSSSHNSFSVAIDALEQIRAEKLSRGQAFPLIAPISCVTRFNLDSLVDLYRLAAGLSDLHVLYLTWWIDEASAQQHTQEFQRRFAQTPNTHRGWIGDWKDFNHRAIAPAFREMMAIYKSTGDCPAVLFPPLTAERDLQRYYSDHGATFGYRECVSVFMTAEINSNGDVSLCRDYNDYVIGNIGEQSLPDLWNGARARTFRASLRRDGLMPVCRRCCGLMGY